MTSLILLLRNHVLFSIGKFYQESMGWIWARPTLPMLEAMTQNRERDQPLCCTPVNTAARRSSDGGSPVDNNRERGPAYISSQSLLLPLLPLLPLLALNSKEWDDEPLELR